MKLNEALAAASQLLVEQESNFVIGKIGGTWQIADEGDDGRINEMEPDSVLAVACDGVAEGYEQRYNELLEAGE